MRGDINGTSTLLDDTATDVNATTCGGTLDDNNMFGEGRLNAFAAVSAAPRGPTGTLAGRVTDAATGAGIAGATVTATGPSQRTATTGNDGSYTLPLAAGTYTVTASHGLYNSATATGVVITANPPTTRTFALTRLPTGTLTGAVTAQSTGLPLAVELGPGMLNGIFDGIQRPLDKLMESSGTYIDRGIVVNALSQDTKWPFTPSVKKGDEVVTVGGLYGRIMSLDAEKVSLKIAESVKIDVERSKVVRVVTPRIEEVESK